MTFGHIPGSFNKFTYKPKNSAAMQRKFEAKHNGRRAVKGGAGL